MENHITAKDLEPMFAVETLGDELKKKIVAELVSDKWEFNENKAEMIFAWYISVRYKNKFFISICTSESFNFNKTRRTNSFFGKL